MITTLYRKYRSHHFQDLRGQATVSRILQQAILRDRVGHAYLFSGPRGTGKTSTARIFAQTLNCLSPITTESTIEACNTCRNCQAILANQATDVVEIDAASNRGIEDIRTLREQVMYPPLQLKRKVYIIDEVHMLTTEAFNALLKTLEEPPSYCLFILATTESHKVPLTVRSRCQVLTFNSGTVTDIVNKLQHIVTQEKLSVEDGVLELIAQQASGGFRDAETLLEKLSTEHQPLTLAQARDTLGIPETDSIERLFHACFSGNVQELITLLHDPRIVPQQAPEQFTTHLINHVRELLYSSEKDSTPIPLSGISKALDALLEAYILQKSSPLPALPLELALIRICQQALPEQQPPIPDPAPRPSKVAQPVVTKPGSATPTVATIITPVATPSVPVIELTQESEKCKDIRKAWKQMSDILCQENLALGQCLKQVTFHTCDQTTIIIHVRYRFHADLLQEKKNASLIEKVLQDLTGQKYGIQYEINASVPRQKNHKELAAVNDAASAVFGNSPTS